MKIYIFVFNFKHLIMLLQKNVICFSTMHKAILSCKIVLFVEFIGIILFRKLATVLVQRGKLLNSSILVAGTAWGKVRMMLDNQNNVLQEANPSDAVQILGWKDLPQAGQEFLQVSCDVMIFKTIILFVKNKYSKLFNNTLNQVFCYYCIETCTGSS